MRFEDKVVIVTGASSGIGEGVARKFLDEGALVVGCGIEPEMHIESSRAIYVPVSYTHLTQEILISSLGNEGPILGASLKAIEEFFEILSAHG